MHRPLKSLSQVPPIDAAGHAGLKKKLSGVIQFLQECAAMTHYPCDFDRLRRKLGLAQAARFDIRDGSQKRKPRVS